MQHNQIVSGTNRNTRIVLGIDPGTTKSAYALIQGHKVLKTGKVENFNMVGICQSFEALPDVVAIESIVSQGRKFVGNETFATCWWSGRFYEAFSNTKAIMVRRMDVANFHVKNDPKKGDTQVRRALIDFYGGEALAIGKKKSPGQLYHLTADQWSALAIALYAQWIVPVSLKHG